LESNLNAKFEQLSLKLVNQIQNIERTVLEERKNTQDLINNEISHLEQKVDQRLILKISDLVGKLDNVSKSSVQDKNDLLLLTESLKIYEKKTSTRIRELNTDYQNDMNTLSESVSALSKLFDNKIKLLKDGF